MRVTERKHENPFWIVWCPNRGKAHIRHETEAAALAEAERLAKLESETFYVMQSRCAVGHQVIDVTTRTFFNDQPLTAAA